MDVLGFVAVFLLVAAAPVPAQTPSTCEVLLRDGRRIEASQIDSRDNGQWSVGAAGASRVVARADVLAVLGVAVESSDLPEVRLHGGDVLRGLLVGGDNHGDRLELQSPSLGRVPIAVDRLACLLLRPDRARAEDLVLPDGTDEALFVEASLGFDRLVGTLHQFGEQGIRFQTSADKEPRWYAARELIGLRLRAEAAVAADALAELWTRAGDRLALQSFCFAGQQLLATPVGGKEHALPLADVGCLVLLGNGIVFASALAPVSVVEGAVGGGVLFPFVRDAAVAGGPLVAGGRTWGRGLGVHSRSRLVFSVPEGAAAFVAHVAFGDAALQLPVRGEVDAAVYVDAAMVWSHKGLRAGEPVRTIGPVPVRPGQQVSLEVDFGGGRDLGDRVDWLLPVFLPVKPTGGR